MGHYTNGKAENMVGNLLVRQKKTYVSTVYLWSEVHLPSSKLYQYLPYDKHMLQVDDIFQSSRSFISDGPIAELPVAPAMLKYLKISPSVFSSNSLYFPLPMRLPSSVNTMGPMRLSLSSKTPTTVVCAVLVSIVTSLCEL